VPRGPRACSTLSAGSVDGVTRVTVVSSAVPSTLARETDRRRATVETDPTLRWRSACARGGAGRFLRTERSGARSKRAGKTGRGSGITVRCLGGGGVPHDGAGTYHRRRRIARAKNRDHHVRIASASPLHSASCDRRRCRDAGFRAEDGSGPCTGIARVVRGHREGCDPEVVTDAVLREVIVRSSLPWRVRDKATGIEMLLVPQGQFMMGVFTTTPAEAGPAGAPDTRSGLPVLASWSKTAESCRSTP